MANIDQRKYLKKYLDDDEAKHRKKKKREHSSSHSGRVKIVDDDAGYTRTRKYDDDDLTLTGEDAPQIAGIIDERPPELQAAEDFRNSSKWRTLGESADRSSRAEGRSFGTSSKNNDRRRTKSPPPPRRDNSPGRRKAYKNLSSSSGRKRHSDDDYSPVRRKRDDEARTREANYCKGERNTTSSDDSYARRREEIGRSTGGSDFGHRRQVEHSDRDSQGRHRLTHYTRHHHYSSQPSAQSRSTHHENKGKGYSNENGRDEYLKSIRSEPVKSNPFRANLPSAQPTVSSSSRDGHNRAVSPAKSGNPFRSNPRNISLSPLPERRGNNSGNDIKRGPRSQKNVDKRHSKSEFRQNSPEMDHTGRHNFNPFRTDKPREMDSNAVARSSAISITKPARTETAQTYRTASHRSELPLTASYCSAYDRKQDLSQNPQSDGRSRNPIKSGVHVVNTQDAREGKFLKKYDEIRDRSNRFREDSTYPPAQRILEIRKPLSSQSSSSYRH